MRINKLIVENFKSIKKIDLSNLGDTVVIAGPNGCGKSSIFDAIRLIKSVYGGYQNNEIDQWFSEFQINTSRIQFDSQRMFRDPSKPIKISIEIELSPSEISYIKKDKLSLIKTLVLSYSSSFSERYQNSLASSRRRFGREIQTEISEQADLIDKLLGSNHFPAELIINPIPNFNIQLSESPILELLFSNYLPNSIGIIDYHGPYRNYSREQVGGVNLSLESENQRMSQSALYNYANKYTNIKSEMATGFIRNLILAANGGKIAEEPLIKTLKELFSTFFPGKEFLGPQPNSDGSISFPVKLSSGEVHDIDDLSSGEKEVLYGYLRIHNTTPRNSVLLLDEPELHLNPRLIRGLPEFYRKYLGNSLGNQIWLTTHSDAFLRETVGQNGFDVFHMEIANGNRVAKNQINKIEVNNELEKAIIDIVGDLATYHPGLKTVIFEGGGDSEFDKVMTFALFPQFQNKVNAISGGDKIKVNELHQALANITERGHLPMKFVSIIDNDADNYEIPSNIPAFKWDVYHIENYLLSEEHILQVLNDLDIAQRKNWTLDLVKTELKSAAEETVHKLVRHRLRLWADQLLEKSIKIDPGNDKSQYSDNVHKTIQSSSQTITKLVLNDLTLDEIKKTERSYYSSYDNDLQNGNWKLTFQGREILKTFTGKHLDGLKYEKFRDLIIRKMVNSNYQPQGMKKIIDRILEM